MVVSLVGLSGCRAGLLTVCSAPEAAAAIHHFTTLPMQNSRILHHAVSDLNAVWSQMRKSDALRHRSAKAESAQLLT